MLGERSHQRGLFQADHMYLDHVGRHSFYGFLASMRGQLFQDEEFADLYCPDNGRDSVPPSLLATALLLLTHDKVSDDEADFIPRLEAKLILGAYPKRFVQLAYEKYAGYPFTGSERNYYWRERKKAQKSLV